MAVGVNDDTKLTTRQHGWILFGLKYPRECEYFNTI